LTNYTFEVLEANLLRVLRLGRGKRQMGAVYLGKKSDLPTLVDGRAFPDEANQLLALPE